jgi:2-methylcitrate dehydratase PrpD
VQDAAFANAVAGHALVRDDMHLGSVSHLGVVVIPVALALATATPVSGRQLLAAIICGYEAGARLGAMLMDVETAKTFRPTGLIGAFAAAATGARLVGLDKNQTAHALGFAANSITGLNEWAAWGSDDMYFHPGIAARNGITAMQLARAGATAAQGALDGAAGLFAALNKTPPADPALPFADGEEIRRVFFKQVPACNYAQTAAQAAVKVRQDNALTPEAIDTISIQVPHAAACYPGCDYAGPFNSVLQARMSIHFNVASALLHGDFHDSHYRDFRNAEVERLAARVTVEVDADLSAAYPTQQGAGITVTGANGKTVSTSLDDVLAATEAEVTARFLEAAGNCIGAEQAQALLTNVMALETSADTAIFS